MPNTIGLAHGARARHRRRRRRQAAVGGIAGALAVAAPLTLILTSHGGASDERNLYAADNYYTTPPTGGWQTIESDGVQAEIPSEWRSFDCRAQSAVPVKRVYGPSDEAACSFRVFAMFVDRDQTRLFRGHEAGDIFRTTLPRSERAAHPHDVRWGGYLLAADQLFAVVTPQLDLTGHILSSATGTDTPPPDEAPTSASSSAVNCRRDGVAPTLDAARLGDIKAVRFCVDGKQAHTAEADVEVLMADLESADEPIENRSLPPCEFDSSGQPVKVLATTSDGIDFQAWTTCDGYLALADDYYLPLRQGALQVLDDVASTGYEGDWH